MDLASARQLLCRLASSRRTRRNEFSASLPCEWRPLQCNHPEHGMFFTDAGAWDFICELLDANEPMVEVALDVPAGGTGYVMKPSGGPGKPKLYVKLQIHQNAVLGRSFHYDEPQPDRRP